MMYEAALYAYGYDTSTVSRTDYGTQLINKYTLPH